MNTQEDAQEAQEERRKELQAAIKDINAVLEPKPKLNIMGRLEFLERQIVDAVAAAIGTNEAGEAIWADKRGESLAQATVDIYDELTSSNGQGEQEEAEIQAEAPAGAEAQAIAEPEPEAAGCEAFLASAGPDEADEECTARCARVAKCRERAEKAKTKTEKPAKPSKDDYNGVNAMVEVLLLNQGRGAKKTDLIATADKIYKQHGATGDINKDFATAIRTLFKALPLMGLATMDENKIFTYIGPADPKIVL